jgi:hypothetical protein
MPTLAGSFSRLFSKRIEETKNDLYSLLRRKVIDGDDVPLDHIIHAASEAGLSGEEVDAIVAKMERRLALKAEAQKLPAIERDAAAIEAAIRKEELSFQDARERHGKAIRPLYERQSEIEARRATATAAQNQVLGEDLLDPGLFERLRAARGAVNAVRDKANRLQAELDGKRAYVARMTNELKAEGIRPSDWKGKTQAEFNLKHPAAPNCLSAAISVLEAEEELPSMEKEYGELCEQLNGARAELTKAEQAAIES